MKAKDLVLKVVNEVKDGKYEIEEFKPYMTYQNFIGCILGDAEILRPTGVEDVTGKEIYEKDIVTYNYNIYGIHYEGVGKVEYKKGKFIIKWRREIVNGKCERENSEESLSRISKLEIVGNVYQTPEFLD